VTDHASVRVCVGARVRYDGQTYTLTEWVTTSTGTEVVLTAATSIVRMSIVTFIEGVRARVICSEPGPDSTDDVDPAAVVLGSLDVAQLRELRQRAGHIREVLTGYQSGSAEMPLPDEPRSQYDRGLPLLQRYAAKAAELGLSKRQVERWVQAYRAHGEAGLASARWQGHDRVDPRWGETALQIMVEHTNESKPSWAAIILQTSKRLELCLGKGVVPEPSRATAYREMKWLDKQQQTFDGTTKRNRDIAARPKRPYRKLRPTRPGEYLILDTTPLDVFAIDPKTLQWVRVELTVAMDWYTRCVVAGRMTPTSTKAVDAAAVMYRTVRPMPADDGWPSYAVWPEHGMPREVLIDPDQIDRTGKPLSGPAVNPETIITDHGKIYVSEHLNSVCQRLGISIQPARIREGRDKGPLERFFRTVREGLLQYLPGYKGPDVNARGLNVEGHACLYIDELERIFRDWVATVYHLRPHHGLIDPGLPSARLTPAEMYSQGIARAGYIEVPRDPHLAYEFLKVEARTIQHYGIDRGTLKYGGPVLEGLATMRSPYRGKFENKWPIHVDPDDVSRIFIKHPDTHEWHVLVWKHATKYPMPFSDEALKYTRKMVLRRDGFVDQKTALDEMLTRHDIRLGQSAEERRIALRIARQDAALSNQVESDADLVAALVSLADTDEADPTSGRGDEPRRQEAEPSDDDADAEPTSRTTTPTTNWTGHDRRPAEPEHRDEGRLEHHRQRRTDTPPEAAHRAARDPAEQCRIDQVQQAATAMAREHGRLADTATAAVARKALGRPR
jgi:transposase InsO family protein